MLLDLVVVIIIVFFAIYGFKRGLMLSILDMTSLLICIIVSSLLASKASYVVVNFGVSDAYQARAIAFIVLFVLSYIGILLLRRFFKALHNLPVIKQLDSFGGLLIGFAQGFLLIFVFVILLQMFSSKVFFANIISMVDKTRMVKFFYDKNFIELIMNHIR